MKRQGFVANSSSSSFMIYGVCFDRDEVKKLLLENCTNPAILEDMKTREGRWGVYDGLDEHIDLTIETGDPNSYGDYLYIGLSWDRIGDNETKLQFQERIRNILVGFFGDKIELGTHSEEWYDG